MVVRKFQQLLNSIQQLASRISPLAIFVLCLAATVTSYLISQHFVQKDENARFERAVKNLNDAIEIRLKIYENVLIATRNYIAASDHISRDGFRTFTAGFDIERRYPGIQGIGFAKRLRGPEVAAYERQVQKSGFPHYRVWPDGNQQEHFPILYLEPFDWRNQRAFGFDMFSEAKRHKAMEQARDTGEPVSTGKLVLVQETDVNRQNGFLVYMPVYKSGMPVETVAQRRQALTGFVYSPFRAGNLFQNISNDVKRSFARIDFSIYDASSEDPDRLLFQTMTEEDTGLSAETHLSHQTSLQIPFAGHMWAVHVRSTPMFEIRSERTLPYLILGFGLIISFLVAFVTDVGKKMNQSLQKELELRKVAQKEVLEARRLAEEANQAKSRFLASMSHEIRTPLGIMIGFTDVALETRDLESDLRNYLLSIKRNGEQLMTLIGEVLDLSKIEANKMEVEYIRFSLPHALEELFSSLSIRAKQKGIDLVWDQSQPIPECINTDLTKFRQVLTNLIGNSIKFTDKGKVCITPCLLTKAEKGVPMRLEFLIEDTGIGISDQQKEKLFQSFTQADVSTTRRFGGTGLGLVLSQHLAQALGGEVKLIRSEPGQGCTFSFQIMAGPFENYWRSGSTQYPSHVAFDVH